MKSRSRIAIALLVLVFLVLSSCSSTGGDTKEGAAPGDAGAVVKLQGAGASFPAPLYTKWFKAYSGSHPNVQIDYQSVGSGSGVKSVMDKTVDFAASDSAMTPEDMGKVDVGVQLLPMTAGAIVLTYNLKDVPGLKLSRKAYSGIFLGEIKKWNDPSIAKANPGLKLPDQPINVVVRADSSGTTFVFTKHLSAISEKFAKSPGANNMPNWAVGTKSKGNEGVTASVMTTPGSIGYIEYGYALSQKLPMAVLENKAGEFVAASTASGTAALASAQMPDDLIVWASDPDVKEAYPIVTYTWLICYKQYKDKMKYDLLQALLQYCLTDGQKDSEALGYIPLPPAVVEKVKAAAQNIKLSAG
jgi:phosphate transport system substrate-binding protein